MRNWNKKKRAFLINIKKKGNVLLLILILMKRMMRTHETPLVHRLLMKNLSKFSVTTALEVLILPIPI